MGYKHWKIAPIDKALAQSIAQDYEIDPFVALLLTARGMTDPAEIEEFLSDEIDFPDPFSFIDMDKAVDRINLAIEQGEKIMVYGDYDGDGITATALIYSCLLDLGADVYYRLPLRDEGYGLNNDAIKEIKEQGISLIVTVDNGVCAFDEIDYANTLGVDVVVTDHHLPADTIPNAVAVVDPHREDCESEFKHYAGVGVAFMLAFALSGYDLETLLYKYSDLVCIGTITDVMPLVEDNRVFVKQGLRLINNSPRIGLEALINASCLEGKEIDSGNVAFVLGPRINAAGRVKDPIVALELLLSNSKEESLELAEQLVKCNSDRKHLETEITKEIANQIEKSPDIVNAPVLVFAGEGWHGGVLGIVAARICEKYSKPAIVFTLEGDKAMGSCRCFQNISLYDLLKSVQELTLKFGGHETAAGVTVSRDKLNEFKEAICKEALNKYTLMPFGEQVIDCKLNPKTISVDTVYSHLSLAPFGTGNPAPLYGLYNMKIAQKNSVGATAQHTRLILERDGVRVPAVWFGVSAETMGYNTGDTVDVCVSLDVSNYNGKENVSVIIKDCKPEGLDFDEFLKNIREYENFLLGMDLPLNEIPTRDDFARVYRYLSAEQIHHIPDEMLPIRFGMDFKKCKIILKAMEELSLATIKSVANKNTISLCKTQGKVDLDTAPCMQRLKEQVR